ncbi:MAG TPA: diaminopimelate epimerase [Gemmatimonadaceae bacterium]|nr:diaminopimelate epimerase [Gemmatimonadaceae bacterium]
MAAPVVGDTRQDLTGASKALAGRRFFKMSGSGNDFVVFDARAEPADELADPRWIRAICARGTGVGADGLVLLESTDGLDFGMRYFNSDGSRAALCGNAALCSTALAVRIGAARAGGLSFLTDSGQVDARLRDGLPEIDLQPVTAVELETAATTEPGEERIGYAKVGVPHLVVLCQDVSQVDVDQRGADLRRHPSTLPDGANVNFVSRLEGGRWRIRTFERGVEGETLACGTGAVATAILLTAWNATAADADIALETASGRPLVVSLDRDGDRWLPALRGEGRVVFEGMLGDL